MSDRFDSSIYKEIDTFKDKYNMEVYYRYVQAIFTDFVHVIETVDTLDQFHKVTKSPLFDLIFVPGLKYDFVVITRPEKRPEIDLILPGAAWHRVTEAFYKFNDKILDGAHFTDSTGNEVDIREMLWMQKTDTESEKSD